MPFSEATRNIWWPHPNDNDPTAGIYPPFSIRNLRRENRVFFLCSSFTSVAFHVAHRTGITGTIVNIPYNGTSLKAIHSIGWSSPYRGL
ncbi:unnamed protein product [Citrullus colocynthis]|uniref:Uncharacterized protein n=1 Tax=Citrullus colocynthis TaxID=252529 RepID=A0ABP0XZJ9_9ROSI